LLSILFEYIIIIILGGYGNKAKTISLHSSLVEKHKKLSIEISSIFVLFALLLQNFLFKAETPTFARLCPRALYSRNTPAALSLSGGR
jgi:hypothetical protein